MQFFSLERYRSRYGHNEEYNETNQQDLRYMNGRSDMYIEEAEDFEDDYSDDDDYDLESPVSDLDIDISEIDFSKVYAYHTFIANVEGQICVQKDDVLDLLDDTHDYWWLVRCISTNEIGYLPADNIELPYERVARANRFKNVQVAAVMPQDTLHRYKERTKKIKFSATPPTIHIVENRQDFEDYDEYGSDEGPFYGEEEEEDDDDNDNEQHNPSNQINNNMYGTSMNIMNNKLNNSINFNNPNGPFGGNNIILSTEPFNHSLSLYDHEEKKYLKKGGFFSKLLKKNKKKKEKNKKLYDYLPQNYNQNYNMTMSLGTNNYNGNMNMYNINSLNRINGINNTNNINMNNLNKMNNISINNDMSNFDRMNGMNVNSNLNVNNFDRMNGMNVNSNSNINNFDRVNGIDINPNSNMNINQNEYTKYNAAAGNYNNSNIPNLTSIQAFPSRNEQPFFQQDYPSPSLNNNIQEYKNTNSFEDRNKDYRLQQKNFIPNESSNIYNNIPNENSFTNKQNISNMEYPDISLNDEERNNIKIMSNENSDDDQEINIEQDSKRRESTHSHLKSHRSERERDRDRDREKEKERDIRKDLKPRISSMHSSSKTSLIDKEKDRRKSERLPSSKRVTLSEKHISVLNPSSSSSINIIKIFTGNFDVEQTPYKSVSVNSNTTVKEMIKSALYRFKLPRDTYHDYYMSVIHFDSKEKTLNPNDEVFKILEHIKNKKLPGATKRLSQSVSILSEEDNANSSLVESNRLSRNILNDRNLKFILNKKNENSSHCRLVRVFIDQKDEFGKKMFKTVGVTSKETAENIIEYALKKFSILHGKSIDDFVLHAYTRKKLIPIRNSYIIFYLIKQEIEKGSRKVDFVMKEKTEHDREREKRKSMRKSKLKVENEDKEKKERIKSTLSQYAMYDDKFDPNETVMIPKIPKPVKSLDKSYSEYSQMSIDLTEEEKEKNNKELTNLINNLKSKGDESVLEGKSITPLSATRARSNSNNSITMKLNKIESPRINSPSMRFGSLDRNNKSNTDASKPNNNNMSSILGKINPRTSSSSYKGFSPSLDEKGSKINKNLAKQRLMPIVKPSHIRDIKDSEASTSSKVIDNENNFAGEEKSNLELLLAKAEQTKNHIKEEENITKEVLDDINDEESDDDEVIIQDPPQMPSKIQNRRGSSASTSSHVNFDEMLSTLDEISVMIPNNSKEKEKPKNDQENEENEVEDVKEEKIEVKQEIKKEDKDDNINNLPENPGFGIKGLITNLFRSNSISKSENESDDKSIKIEEEKEKKIENKNENISQENNDTGSIFNKLKFPTRGSSAEARKNSEDNSNGGSIFDKLKIPSRSTSNTKPNFSPELLSSKKNNSNVSITDLNENEKQSPQIKQDQENEKITTIQEKDKDVQVQNPVLTDATNKDKENLVDSLQDKKEQNEDNIIYSEENITENKEEIKEQLNKNIDNNEKKKELENSESKENDKPKKYKSILKAPKEYPMSEELRKLEDLRLEEAKRSSSIRHSRRLEKRKSKYRENSKDEDSKRDEEEEEVHRRRVRSMVSSRTRSSSRSSSRRHISTRLPERHSSKTKSDNDKNDREESTEDNEERRRRHASRRISERHSSRKSRHVSRRLLPETEEEKVKRHASRRLETDEERARRHASRRLETDEERARRHASRRLETDEERARRHASRRLETEEERARRHASRRLETDEERARRHASRRLETDEEREKRRSRRHLSKRAESNEEHHKRDHSEKDKEENEQTENKDSHRSIMTEKSHERHSRMAERHEHGYSHNSPTRSRINISGDILPNVENGNENEKNYDKVSLQQIKTTTNSDSVKDDQSLSVIDTDDIVIPDRALHMEERLYTKGKGHHSEASNTSMSSIGSGSSILSESSIGSHRSIDSNGSHHHHHHRRHSRSHSHSRNRSGSHDRQSSIHSSNSDIKKRESRHKSMRHRSSHSDSRNKSLGSPLINEKDRRSRHEHIRSRRDYNGEASPKLKADKFDNSKPGVSSSLKVSHRISSMVRPPRIDTRTSLRISIPNRQSIRKSTMSSSSDISINILMDEMRQLMTGTPSREQISPFAKELSKLEKLQKNNEDSGTSLIIENNINRQGSETYRDHIMHKIERSKRNSKTSLGNNSNTSFTSIELWRKAEERQFRFSNSSTDENVGKNIENLKKELEELAIDKEKRKSRLSMHRLSTGSTARSSTANRSSKFDDSYLKSLLDKLSDTKASKRYSQRNSRLVTDIVRKSINLDDRKEEEYEKEQEKQKEQDANDEENNRLLTSLNECEEKFESLNKDLNSILFNSIKLFDNLILS
ncbi:hypothetical protein BCR36DRAFT_333430 [Piromyces finnis]|uniref:SH3 domain-containing protein n=1 Tax=Piromyces finnis TaxID=1754191 RepID=A0A1Y1V3K6_9FUNG|nr:hypothetical protein BCR36DRAFT_333430 [Piromyces finnis]|eukprot:ORX45157.1 hypothetical protein BCR36DRAFT_333430 [Piromyces finnis]